MDGAMLWGCEWRLGCQFTRTPAGCLIHCGGIELSPDHQVLVSPSRVPFSQRPAREIAEDFATFLPVLESQFLPSRKFKLDSLYAPGRAYPIHLSDIDLAWAVGGIVGFQAVENL